MTETIKWKAYRTIGPIHGNPDAISRLELGRSKPVEEKPDNREGDMWFKGVNLSERNRKEWDAVLDTKAGSKWRD